MSKYCTFFFDKLGKVDLKPACANHDNNYKDIYMRRLVADKEFLGDLLIAGLNPRIAKALYRGVRMFAWIGL